MSRTFNDNWAVRLVNTPNVYAAAAVVGSYVDMTGYRRCAFIFGNNELDANMPVQVMEATDTSGTGAQALTGFTLTFVNGTDEARAGIIEVQDEDLSDGYKAVALRVTPGATDGFCGFALLGEAYDLPVSNAAADGVAGIDESA